MDGLRDDLENRRAGESFLECKVKQEKTTTQHRRNLQKGHVPGES